MDNDNEAGGMSKLYKQEIIKTVMQFVGLFFLVYGVFISYIWANLGLDRKSWSLSVTHYFWDPVITVYSVYNVMVFLLIILMKYWSYSSPDQRTAKKPDNYFVVCVMLIPLFIASVAYNTLGFIRDLAILPCRGYMTFTVSLSTLALLTGVAILIFDIGFFKGNVTNWIQKMIRSNLIFFAVVGIANCLLITVALQHMAIFRTDSLNTTFGNRFQINETCIEAKSSSKSIDNFFHICDKYLRPTYILFCICSLAYLIQPMLQIHETDEVSFGTESQEVHDEDSEEDPLLQTEDRCETIQDSVEDDKENHSVSYRLPSISLVLCIIFMSLSLLAFIIKYSLMQDLHNRSHNELGSMIYCCFISVMYAIGSWISLVHIKEISRWPVSPKGHGNIIDKCLIWVGVGGQMSVALCFVSGAIVSLVETPYDPRFIGLLSMILVSSILMVSQTFLQTVQISLLLDRKWIRPRINSLAESVCPAVGLMGLNFGLLMLSIHQLKSPILTRETPILFVNLFARELKCVGETLGILQRLHAALLFASMIVFTHN